jgi:hypothetical protein
MLLYCCEINEELVLDKVKDFCEAHSSFTGKDKIVLDFIMN